jgi:murein DD-endopeptidase MepM/ murein hydrolase activator NlpD
MTRAIPIVLLFILSAPAWAVEVRRECRDDFLCVVTEERGHSVTLWIEPLTPYPATITLAASTSALEAVEGHRRTITVAGGERQRLLRFRRDQLDVAYRLRLRWAWTVGVRDAEHDDSAIYYMPYASGRSYRVLQGNGARFSHRRNEYYAVDFDMEEGTPVHAARAGVVARVVEANDRGCWRDGCGRWANFIIVLHADGTTGQYYHLMQDGSAVAVGDSVEAGQLIGYSGNTGHTAMPHLHFAVYAAGEWGAKHSVQVRYRTAAGEVDSPRRGRRYRAE